MANLKETCALTYRKFVFEQGNNIPYYSEKFQFFGGTPPDFFRKATLKSKFSDFLISKIPFRGYFQGNVCTHFQKICIWTRQKHSGFIRETSSFWVTLLHFCFRKTTLKFKFTEFFLPSERPFRGYFQWNACTYFQEICSWTKSNSAKFIRETLISLVALLSFCFGETI